MPKVATKQAVPAAENSLRTKMAQATAGKGGSLVPAGMGGTKAPEMPPPDKDKEPIREMETLISDKETLQTLTDLLRAQLEYNKLKKKYESALEPINARIRTILQDNQIAGRVVYGNADINYFSAERKSLSADLLLAAGVDNQTIQECTITTKSGTLVIKDRK